MIRRRTMLAALPLAAIATGARAQEGWPQRPIRVMVGFAAGGATDITTRSLAPKLQSLLGQPIIVDNRPGAGGNLATELVVRAPADGYTLLMGTIGALAINPTLYGNLSFDPQADLTPVAMAGDILNILVIPADRPWRSVADLIAAARAQPDTLTYGSSGVGGAGHLAGALLDQEARIRTVHVPYRGGGQLITDILSGKVDYSVATAATVLPHIEAGRLRALAVPSPARTALLPDVPTVAEAAGLPGYAIPNWYALMGPRALPEPIVARLSEAMLETLRDPETVAHLTRHGLEPSPSGPAELLRQMREETARWAPILRDAGANAN